MRINPNQLFVVDGLGALSSATLLFFIVGEYEYFFGIPKTTSHMLSLIALLISIHSLACRLMVKRKRKTFLLAIAIANVSYIIFTAGFLIYYYHQLNRLGMLYFFSEMAIIMALVYLELSFTNKPNS